MSGQRDEQRPFLEKHEQSVAKHRLAIAHEFEAVLKAHGFEVADTDDTLKGEEGEDGLIRPSTFQTLVDTIQSHRLNQAQQEAALEVGQELDETVSDGSQVWQVAEVIELQAKGANAE